MVSSEGNKFANSELNSEFAKMFDRFIAHELIDLLEVFPAVALLGPRQSGKTTLALQLRRHFDLLYLDLESENDRAKLQNPALYLGQHMGKLIILDEIQRVPQLFQELRGIIDNNRRAGIKSAQFLLLGSASMDLLHQSGESLAGRIAYMELGPFTVWEYPNDIDLLWLRGGFPESVLARSGKSSMLWRQNFIRTYLERDIPQLGPRIPAETLRRFWTMLAHLQGSPLNASSLGRSLGADSKTISSYLDLMVDLLLVRRLEPYYRNLGKRLIKAPKIYVRDSGLLHSLLRIGTQEQLLSHPIAGNSWEGFVVENVFQVLQNKDISISYYRTGSGNEIDLLLEYPQGLVTIEIKRSTSPKVGRGFHQAIRDLHTWKNILVAPVTESYPLSEDIQVMSLPMLLQFLQALRDL